MANFVIAGDTSGTVTLQAPAVSGTTTLTLPTTSGTILTTATGQTLTSPTITGAVVSSMASSVITSSTAQASTSGTSITFTGIPSWVKRITVMFNGVSTSGTSNILVQVGAGSTATTGYNTNGGYIYSGGSGYTVSGTSFIAGLANASASSFIQGLVTICSFGSNNWVSSTTFAQTSVNLVGWSAGSVALGGTLDRVVITTANGTDTFDAGSINILYE